MIGELQSIRQQMRFMLIFEQMETEKILLQYMDLERLDYLQFNMQNILAVKRL